MFRQDDGGAAQTVEPYGDSDFCFHDKNVYELKLTSTDTNATNLPFRDKVGVPNWRAAKGTGDGVYYIDNTDQADPQFRLMSLDAISSKVLPKSISKRTTKQGVILGIELTEYQFDDSVVFEWGDYVFFAYKTPDERKTTVWLSTTKKPGP